MKESLAKQLVIHINKETEELPDTDFIDTLESIIESLQEEVDIKKAELGGLENDRNI